jgi:hypothetical protein
MYQVSKGIVENLIAILAGVLRWTLSLMAAGCINIYHL